MLTSGAFDFVIDFRAYRLLNSWLERFNLGSQHHDDDPLLSRYMQMKWVPSPVQWFLADALCVQVV